MTGRLIAFLFFIGVPVAVLAGEEPKLTLVVVEKGGFDLLYHRADSTATGAALGGLIGAGIEEGVRSGADDKKRLLLLEHMDDISCRTSFVQSLESKLGAANFSVLTLIEPGKKKQQAEELNLKVTLKGCGFKMVDSATKKVSAFVDFEMQLTGADGTLLKLEKNNLFLGRKQYHFEDLVTADSVANTELQDVLSRAGGRLANKIIYRK